MSIIGRPPQVTINWQYPCVIENILVDERIYERGVYYISRKFGRKETLLYIGKTYVRFRNRLLSHIENEKFSDYRGKLFIRLGFVAPSMSKTEDELRTLIDDIERGLIFEMRDFLPENQKGKSSYTPTKFYTITNKGFRGFLPTTIIMREHIE